MARMASERSVKLAFGPKKGRWRIEADVAGEARVSRQIASGSGRAHTLLAKNKSKTGHSAASMRALSILQNASAGSLHSTTSTDSADQQRMGGGSETQSQAAPEPPLDPARLALPISGKGMEVLRRELVKLQPIDDSSASDQVPL
jgi:hypothetical protein